MRRAKIRRGRFAAHEQGSHSNNQFVRLACCSVLLFVQLLIFSPATEKPLTPSRLVCQC